MTDYEIEYEEKGTKIIIEGITKYNTAKEMKEDLEKEGKKDVKINKTK